MIGGFSSLFLAPSVLFLTLAGVKYFRKIEKKKEKKKKENVGKKGKRNKALIEDFN